MIPEVAADIIYSEEQVIPSLTYRVDLENNRIYGMVDGRDAIVQAVAHILNTERFAYEIYSANYGVEMENLIGQDPSYVTSVLEQRISEALMADDRISGIDNFTTSRPNKNTVLVSFRVLSDEGVIQIESEARI